MKKYKSKLRKAYECLAEECNMGEFEEKIGKKFSREEKGYMIKKNNKYTWLSKGAFEREFFS